MDINFVLRKKPNRKGLVPLEMSVADNYGRKYVSTGLKFPSKPADDVIDTLKSKAYTLIGEMIKSGIVVTIDSFIDAWKNGIRKQQTTLLALFDKEIEHITKQVECNARSKTLIQKYRKTKEDVAAFLGSDIQLNQITPDFFEQLYLYFRKSCCNNTAVQMMARLGT